MKNFKRRQIIFATLAYHYRNFYFFGGNIQRILVYLSRRGFQHNNTINLCVSVSAHSNISHYSLVYKKKIISFALHVTKHSKINDHQINIICVILKWKRIKGRTTTTTRTDAPHTYWITYHVTIISH